MRGHISKVIFLLLVVLFLSTPQQQSLAADKARLSVPDDWAESFRQEQNSVQLVEYLRKGDTSERWSQMITLIQTPAHGPEAVKSILGSGVQAVASRCKEKAISRGRYWEKNGKAIGIIVEVACDNIDTSNTPPSVEARSKELLRLFVADSPQGIFNIQLAWHHNTQSAAALLEDAAQTELFHGLIEDATTFVQ